MICRAELYTEEAIKRMHSDLQIPCKRLRDPWNSVSNIETFSAGRNCLLDNNTKVGSALWNTKMMDIFSEIIKINAMGRDLLFIFTYIECAIRFQVKIYWWIARMLKKHRQQCKSQLRKKL